LVWDKIHEELLKKFLLKSNVLHSLKLYLLENSLSTFLNCYPSFANLSYLTIETPLGKKVIKKLGKAVSPKNAYPSQVSTINLRHLSIHDNSAKESAIELQLNKKLLRCLLNIISLPKLEKLLIAQEHLPKTEFLEEGISLKEPKLSTSEKQNFFLLGQGISKNLKIQELYLTFINTPNKARIFVESLDNNGQLCILRFPKTVIHTHVHTYKNRNNLYTSVRRTTDLTQLSINKKEQWVFSKEENGIH